MTDRRRIDRRWLPLNALRAFEAVARHASFTGAANALRISQSALSRHVISIEKLIGVQLFDRRPHSLVLTKAGQHLLPTVIKSFDRLEYSLDEIRNAGAPTLRTLHVQMPPSFAARLAIPALRDFRRANPDIEIDLVSPYGVGAPPSDVDVAVVYSKPAVSEYVSDLLWPVKLSILCHPDIAGRHAGKDLAGWIRDNELIHVRIADLPRHHVWTQLARQASLGHVNFERGLIFDTALLAVEYALSGEGLALVDVNLFAEELRTGRLVRPFDLSLDDGYGYYLVTQPDALSDTAIALFRSWMIEHFGPHRPGEQSAPGDQSGPGEQSAMRLAVSND
jgi:DNA-binding transcriptional LysR family regulator